jgi:ribosomal protein S18 acetylase RimI-like enzyme
VGRPVARTWKGISVIHYRTFLNPDPPLLARIWNASVVGRRALPIQAATLLEYFTFAKPYFDPAGMIFALDDDRPAGVVHAGFAAVVEGTALDTSVGIICVLGVIPIQRRRGIGSELLRRAEDYLRGRGAREILFGSMAPRNPYLFGLYGGCDSPGVLAAEELARPFLERRGYAVARSCGIFQKPMERLLFPQDPRFAALSQRFDIVVAPFSHAGWWRECVLGPIEAFEYRLQEKNNNQVVARTILWDMGTFGPSWGETCIGMIDLDVKPAFRRQGLAKYLLSQVLRHLRQHPIKTFEVQAALDNAPLLGLLNGLGFLQVETGHTFRRTAPNAGAPAAPVKGADGGEWCFP